MSIKQTSIAAGLGGLLIALASATPSTAFADYSVTCASEGYKHSTCSLSKAGRVTLKRQISRKTRCDQGRNWDYDRRQIWVDDGCAAEFQVESSSRDSKDLGSAVGLVAAAVLLGALTDTDKNKDSNHGRAEQYQNDNYYGPRHSSYVADWMVGQFRGVNVKYNNTEVLMTVKSDGQLSALASGQEIRGYINDGYVHIGDSVFTINRSREGFVTSQVGDQDNVVRYQRIN